MTQPDGPHTLNFTWLCPQSGAGADVDAFMYLCAAMDGRPRKDLPAVVLDLAALGATARTQSFKAAVELALGAYNDRAPRYPWRQNGTDEHELKSAKSREQGRRFKVALPLNRGAHLVVKAWISAEIGRGAEARDALLDALTMGARVLSVAKGGDLPMQALPPAPAQASANGRGQEAPRAKRQNTAPVQTGRPSPQSVPNDDSARSVPIAAVIAEQSSDGVVSLVPMLEAIADQGESQSVEGELAGDFPFDNSIFAISVADMDPSTWST